MKKLMKMEITAIAVLAILAGLFAVKLSRAQPEPAAPVMAESETTGPAETTIPNTTPPTTESGPDWMTFPENRVLTAKQYFVYDVDQGQFLERSSQNSEKVYPASITKLFTAYVAMQYLQPETEVTAGDALDMVVWGSSVAEIQKGDTLNVDLLVESMLLPSGNDAAYLLAAEAGRVISGDGTMNAQAAVAAFVNKMNETARGLGMTGTHFVNPDGIHDETHYTTFEDLAILGKMALENPTIMKNAGTARDKAVLASGQKEWENTNALVDEKTPYFCPYAVGLKTGQTPSAGSCLLSAFRMEGRTLLIGVFGCPEEEDRFEDTLQLFNKTMGI